MLIYSGHFLSFLLLCIFHNPSISLGVIIITVFFRIIMGSLPDVSELRARLENTLISYHHLEEKEWKVAKKSVRVLISYYLRMQ